MCLSSLAKLVGIFLEVFVSDYAVYLEEDVVKFLDSLEKVKVFALIFLLAKTVVCYNAKSPQKTSKVDFVFRKLENSEYLPKNSHFLLQNLLPVSPQSC